MFYRARGTAHGVGVVDLTCDSRLRASGNPSGTSSEAQRPQSGAAGRLLSLQRSDVRSKEIYGPTHVTWVAISMASYIGNKFGEADVNKLVSRILLGNLCVWFVLQRFIDRIMNWSRGTGWSLQEQPVHRS